PPHPGGGVDVGGVAAQRLEVALGELEVEPHEERRGPEPPAVDHLADPGRDDVVELRERRDPVVLAEQGGARGVVADLCQPFDHLGDRRRRCVPGQLGQALGAPRGRRLAGDLSHRQLPSVPIKEHRLVRLIRSSIMSVPGCPGPAGGDGLVAGGTGAVASQDVTERRPQRPLVGRGEQLAELLAALEAARHGRMATIFLNGDAGIGKTRLVQELVARAEGAGATVLFGAATDIAESPPFWPVVSAVRALLRSPRGEDARRALAPWSDQLDELLVLRAAAEPLARVQTL